jgi:hypothetical protein
MQARHRRAARAVTEPQDHGVYALDDGRSAGVTAKEAHPGRNCSDIHLQKNFLAQSGTRRFSYAIASVSIIPLEEFSLSHDTGTWS